MRPVGQVEVNGQVPQPDLRGVCPWPAANLDAVRYMTHDITSLLATGNRNAIGLLLGEVNHGKVAAKLASQVIVLIAVKFASSHERWFFASGEGGGWQATQSYVDGGAWSTSIDWTQRQLGWSTAAFAPTPARWIAMNATPADPGALPTRALAMPIATVLREVQPSTVTALPDGAFLYRFPKNFVGTVRIAPLPTAETNSSLTVLLGEWLDPGIPDSSQKPGGGYKGPRVYPSISESVDGQQYENHVLVKGNTKPLTTLFCYHGFQWVRVDSTNHTGFVSLIVCPMKSTQLLAD